MDGKRKMRASANGSYNDYMEDFDDQVRLNAPILAAPVLIMSQSNPSKAQRVREGKARSHLEVQTAAQRSLPGPSMAFAEEALCVQVYVPQRASTRRRPGVDFTKLTVRLSPWHIISSRVLVQGAAMMIMIVPVQP